MTKLQNKIKAEIKKNAKLSEKTDVAEYEEIERLDKLILASWGRLYKMMVQVTKDEWNEASIKAIGTTECFEYETN